jgi:hypothetical protein
METLNVTLEMLEAALDSLADLAPEGDTRSEVERDAQTMALWSRLDAAYQAGRAASLKRYAAKFQTDSITPAVIARHLAK